MKLFVYAPASMHGNWANVSFFIFYSYIKPADRRILSLVMATSKERIDYVVTPFENFESYND